MPRRNQTIPNKRPVEQYDHKDKKRLNDPPVGLVDASTDAAEGRKTYAYDPHLDPQLIWAGKAERTSFETPTVSLHVQCCAGGRPSRARPGWCVTASSNRYRTPCCACPTRRCVFSGFSAAPSRHAPGAEILERASRPTGVGGSPDR
ncbi:MAG: hypothetical protein ACR2L2_08560, partial [Acidobacteriota bacterium]